MQKKMPAPSFQGYPFNLFHILTMKPECHAKAALAAATKQRNVLLLIKAQVLDLLGFTFFVA